MKKDEKKITIKSVIKKFAPEKKHLYGVTLVTSGLAGIMQVIPFYLVYKLIEELLLQNMNLGMERVREYAIYIFVTQVMGILANFGALYASHSLAFRVETNMRKNGVTHLVTLPIGFFQNEDTGRLRRVIDDNASQTHTFLAHIFPDMTSAMVIPLLLILIIVFVDLRLGFVCIIGIVLSFVFMGSIMANSEMREKMNDYATSGEQLNISGVEYIRGIPIVKVFNQSVESFQKFYESIMDYDRRAKDLVFGFKRPMIFNILSLNAPAILLGPIALFLLQGDAHPKELFVKAIFYIIISFLLQSAFMKVTTINEAQQQFQVALNRLEDILALEPGKVEEHPSVSEKGVLLKDVVFTYPNREEKVLDHVNFHFEKGKSYALVGGSGSGKSTLIKLIARLYDVDQGGIYVEGKDVRSYEMEDLLNHMAIVFQETSLLKGTLRENITMGQEYSDQEVLQAMKNAQCMDIYERMDKNLDTFIGTKGTFVSGGEAQRIALARAFLKNSDILLLDEASAYADTENEEKIRKSIALLKKNKLTISIAHRLNSIKGSDVILVLKEGSIIASGSHNELMENSREYRELFNEYKGSIDWKIGKKGEEICTDF
ncbi:MAG: ABC transporter ATP-binding protein [Tissierellia bacterium]|nr:ABC transporter ATP-binding protein [Tissierellia bacterium]